MLYVFFIIEQKMIVKMLLHCQNEFQFNGNDLFMKRARTNTED